ncbi:MAG: aminoacetone oxidase family FAD-binding enzyme, partial [Anaerovoracaceae bacterium]
YATGNGRCNISNLRWHKELEEKKEEDIVLDFFHKVGIKLKTVPFFANTMFPVSEQASDVVKVFENEIINENKIQLLLNSNVHRINKIIDGFEVSYLEDSVKHTILARKVILATGGKAAPQFGSTGDGYRFAKDLGHSVSRLAPALAGIEIYGETEKLKGTRVKADLRVHRKSKIVFRESGEVQFTKDGISGIVALNASLHIIPDDPNTILEGMKEYTITLNFLQNDENWEKYFLERRDKKSLLVRDLLLTLVPEALGTQVLIRALSNNATRLSSRAKDLTDTEIKNIVYELQNFTLNVKGIKGWRDAQTTAGGVKVSEINPNTMESEIVKDLYITGELQEYGFPCGGNNLYFAWKSGLLAGRTASLPADNNVEKPIRER